MLLKEDFTKPNEYPLCKVLSLQTNSLQEVTGVTLKKGKTGEVIHRHISRIIPLFSPKIDSVNAGENITQTESDKPDSSPSLNAPEERPKRKAGILSSEKTKLMLNNE